VYAIGDLIATPQLAHVAYAEAILVVKQVLGESPMPVMYDRVPWAIYCHPEVAWAGPDEEQAQARPATTSSWPSTRSSSTAER
jgi:dihydrolipoamide dehydrogenase